MEDFPSCPACTSSYDRIGSDGWKPCREINENQFWHKKTIYIIIAGKSYGFVYGAGMAGQDLARWRRTLYCHTCGYSWDEIA